MTVALHHRVAGTPGAPPLLLGPSLGATAAAWEPQIAALAERFYVVAFDTRGHGASPVPTGPYELSDLAGDVLALMDRLGFARASYAGLSLGGMVGMWLAAHAAGRIDRLALVCTSPHMPPASAWDERARAVRAAGTCAVVADAVVARWLTPEYAGSHPDVRDRLRAMIAAIPADGYAACCGAIGRMDLRGVLSAIAAPTLVVAGDEDPATPPYEHGGVIVERIAGARLTVLSPAAHLANVEQADAVTALLVEHLTAEDDL